MNETTNTYTKEQHELIADLCTTYGIEPDQIVFFENDPEPIFDREATSKIARALLPVAGIEDDFVPASSPDSVAAKYRITFKDGTFAASTGVATRSSDDSQSDEQLRSAAIGRAARSAFRNAGINLLKLHFARKSSNVATPEFTGQPADSVSTEPVKSERSRLLATVHMLGAEAGLITADNNKNAWYRSIEQRYGIDSCYGLDNDQLKDFASFLRSQLPARAA